MSRTHRSRRWKTDEVEGVPTPVPRAGKNWEECGGERGRRGGGEIKENLRLHYTIDVLIKAPL